MLVSKRNELKMLQSYVPNVTRQIWEDLKDGRTVVGTMFREVESLDQIAPFRLAKYLGYRIVVIDCEHKAFNEERLAAYAKNAHTIGLSLWLRPTQQYEEAISKYADIGISGFMVPNAIELERVKKIVDRAYFDPIADKRAYIRRGYSMGDVVLDGKKFKNIKEEIQYANSNMIVVLQTEHPDGIDNLANLFSISKKGIVGTIIGPNDLAINLSRLERNQGIIRQDRDKMYEHKVMINAYQRIAKTALSKGRVAGIHFTDRKQMGLVEKLVGDLGYRLILLGTEDNFDRPEILETKRTIENISS